MTSSVPRILEPEREQSGNYDTLALNNIAEKIMMLESSGGKNNYSKCQAIGLYNRYGYGIPGNGKYLCFEKGEDTKAVKDWFAENIEKYGLEKSLCRYNLGKPIENCQYANKFKNI